MYIVIINFEIWIAVAEQKTRRQGCLRAVIHEAIEFRFGMHQVRG